MDVRSTSTADDVKTVVATTLELGARANTLDLATPLLGSLPELDSMAVLELLVALEQHFGVVIADDEVNAEIFETLGTLVAFIEAKVA
jgi:acyl carrier protein